MAEETDKVPADVSEPDQPVEEQSEESVKEPSEVEKLAEMTQNLQKGYTVTRQELSEIKENLQSIADNINKQTGATTGQDEYLTVGKLREILNQQTMEETQRKSQADQYIDTTLMQLRAEGVVSNEQEENDLLNYALKIKEPDLLKAATIYKDIREAKNEAKKQIVKTKVKQEEGSKVGTSSKAAGGESKGVDYKKVHNTDWIEL